MAPHHMHVTAVSGILFPHFVHVIGIPYLRADWRRREDQVRSKIVAQASRVFNTD
ncbi:MAG: hypothetical protein HYX75_17090 [Acidobacteria bacterium]|nr:hypothetical protein [Acidobacteriota bacterium]